MRWASHQAGRGPESQHPTKGRMLLMPHAQLAHTAEVLMLRHRCLCQLWEQWRAQGGHPGDCRPADDQQNAAGRDWQVAAC